MAKAWGHGGAARLAVGLVAAGSLLLVGCATTVSGSASPAPGDIKLSQGAPPSSGLPTSVPSLPPTSDPGGGGGSGGSGGCSGLMVSDVESALKTSGISASDQSPSGGGGTSACVFTKNSLPVLAVSTASIQVSAPIAASKFVEGATQGKSTQPLSGVGDSAAYLAKSDLGGPGVVAAQGVGGKTVGVVLFSSPDAGSNLKSALSDLARTALSAGG